MILAAGFEGGTIKLGLLKNARLRAQPSGVPPPLTNKPFNRTVPLEAGNAPLLRTVFRTKLK